MSKNWHYHSRWEKVHFFYNLEEEVKISNGPRSQAFIPAVEYWICRWFHYMQDWTDTTKHGKKEKKNNLIFTYLISVYELDSA